MWKSSVSLNYYLGKHFKWLNYRLHRFDGLNWQIGNKDVADKGAENVDLSEPSYKAVIKLIYLLTRGALFGLTPNVERPCIIPCCIFKGGPRANPHRTLHFPANLFLSDRFDIHFLIHIHKDGKSFTNCIQRRFMWVTVLEEKFHKPYKRGIKERFWWWNLMSKNLIKEIVEGDVPQNTYY